MKTKHNISICKFKVRIYITFDKITDITPKCLCERAVAK